MWIFSHFDDLDTIIMCLFNIFMCRKVCVDSVNAKLATISTHTTYCKPMYFCVDVILCFIDRRLFHDE